MAKETLLTIVQYMLDAATEDSVNSIDDTEASTSAALIAKQTFFSLINEDDWPWLMGVRGLDSLSDITQPTVVQIPDNVTLIDAEEFMQYDSTEVGATNSSYTDLIYKEPGDFLRMIRGRNDSASNVTKYTGYASTALLIITDKMPEYWTSFDDEYIVMDSYHSATESTLQGSKISVEAKTIPTWTHTDAAIPDLPENMFPTYIARCKTKYNAYHTQKSNPIDQLEATSGQARQRRKGKRTAGRGKKPSYGRNRRGRIS